MSDTETEDTPVEPEPEPDTDEETTEDMAAEGRCEAQVTTSSGVYRCALQEEHDGDHAYAQVDTGEVLEAPEQAQGEAEMLAANKKVAKSAQTYWESVRRNYGDDLGGFHECPLCVGYPPGLFFPSELPPEKKAALKSLLGLPALDNYKRDNAFLTCSTCDGLGTVLTGSKVPGKDTHMCVDCDGRGYITHDANRTAPARSPLLDAPVNGGEVVMDDPPPYDPWGRAYGDPDYYRMPIPGATT